MWNMPKCSIYLITSSSSSSYLVFSSLCLCLSVQNYGHVYVFKCVCVCEIVLILCEGLLFFFCTGRQWWWGGRGGTPRRASLCGPVSQSEWDPIRRLPTRMHSRLSWQSEAHWPVTEIKRRAISVTKTTCSIEGKMGSRREKGKEMEKEHRETCWYSLLLGASVNDAFCPFHPLLSIWERRGGKRDVGFWTDSFFTHVRQVLSYCVGHKKTNAHKRGCFLSTGSVYASYGQCLLTQKPFTFPVVHVCLFAKTRTGINMCTSWNINLKWVARWSTMRAFVWITHNPTLWWQSIRALNRREGGGRKKERNLSC